MTTVLTAKGKVTIPMAIRDALGLKPGTPVTFEVNKEGQVLILKALGAHKHSQDRFPAALGKAGVKWRTKDLMTLLRGDDRCT